MITDKFLYENKIIIFICLRCSNFSSLLFDNNKNINAADNDKELYSQKMFTSRQTIDNDFMAIEEFGVGRDVSNCENQR